MKKKSSPEKKKNSLSLKKKKAVGNKTVTGNASVKSGQNAKIISKGSAKKTSVNVFKYPVMITAGEHSGDLLGSDIIKSFHKKDIVRFFGTGGPRMEKEGVEIIENVENMSVLGFIEAFQAYRRLKKLALHLVDLAVANKTRLAILIDYPGFNLRLAAMLKEKGIHVVFVVSPQIWAWKYGRIHSIKKFVDLMLVLFPFEKEIYEREGINCEWIGHPLVKRIPLQLKSETAVKKYNGITVGLMPGSRRSEVSRHLSAMLQAAEILAERFGKIRFLIPCIDSSLKEMIEKELIHHPGLNAEVYDGNSLAVMNASRMIILSSGTATLEASFFRKPMVIVYKVSWINFIIASLLSRVRFIGLVNILARKQTALELLQKEVTPANIADEASRILTDRKYRENMISEMDYVNSHLGKGNPASKAVDAVMRHFVKRT
ncbi:MAG: lipid-A-disaccharide synthase [Spirochaetia bacterium]|nr:lipid-A-disaccharide synthase [Spirochaetia bacterium]